MKAENSSIAVVALRQVHFKFVIAFPASVTLWDVNNTPLIALCFSIEGEYVPVEGDEVTYKVCRVPPKNLKVQAVEVKITHLKPGTKHETWAGQIISS